MFFDGVFVGGAVAVIVAAGFVGVVDDGREPDRGGAEAGDVIEVLLDAAQIAAVIGAGIGTIHVGGWRVIRSVAVGKTVGHDEVHHVFRAEALIATVAAGPIAERKSEGQAGARVGVNCARGRARFRDLIERNGDEESSGPGPWRGLRRRARRVRCTSRRRRRDFRRRREVGRMA